MKTKTVKYAPAKYFELDEIELALVDNGCGPDGILGKIIPDKILGINLGPVCSAHDFSYAFSGNRKQADYDLWRNGNRAVDEAICEFNWFLILPQSMFGSIIIGFYYLFVRIFGDNYFDKE